MMKMECRGRRRCSSRRRQSTPTALSDFTPEGFPPSTAASSSSASVLFGCVTNYLPQSHDTLLLVPLLDVLIAITSHHSPPPNHQKSSNRPKTLQDLHKPHPTRNLRLQNVPLSRPASHKPSKHPQMVCNPSNQTQLPGHHQLTLHLNPQARNQRPPPQTARQQLPNLQRPPHNHDRRRSQRPHRLPHQQHPRILLPAQRSHALKNHRTDNNRV
jgi:hypothetical protein